MTGGEWARPAPRGAAPLAAPLPPARVRATSQKDFPVIRFLSFLVTLLLASSLHAACTGP